MSWASHRQVRGQLFYSDSLATARDGPRCSRECGMGQIEEGDGKAGPVSNTYTFMVYSLLRLCLAHLLAAIYYAVIYMRRLDKPVSHVVVSTRCASFQALFEAAQIVLFGHT